MEKDSPDAASPAQQFGTTMRIDLSPERLEEARAARGRREPRPATQPIISLPKPRATPSRGSADFQQLLQNIYDAALITDLSGEVVMVNPRANQFFLALPGQLTHYSILTLIGGADASLMPTILETLKANRFVLLQAYCVRTDGSFFAAEISVNRMRLSEKDHLTFFIRDITLRKDQEERLRTGSTALQNSSSGILISGLDGQIQYGNPAFLALFKLEQAEGTDLRLLVREPKLVEEILGATTLGQAWAGELELRRTDGCTFFGEASVAPNLNTEGELVGLVLSVLDITPRKIAQQQLEAYASELHQKNSQLQEDLNIASELHRAFLPAGFKTFPQDAAPRDVLLRASHLYCPSGTIGGDFYDVRALSEHELAFFISDVMGHGIRSALVVATIRGLIEQLRPVAHDPGALLTQLNATYSTIFQQMGGDVIFSTALYAVIDTRTGLCRCANASHPRPFRLRRDESTCEQITFSAGGPRAPLGIFPETNYATTEVQLAPGDLLLLHTDGLGEVENPAGDLYEMSRFEKTLQAKMNLPAEELLDALIADAKEFGGTDGFTDDVCLLAIEVERLASS
jgi:PAS domain S-box-containing protein